MTHITRRRLLEHATTVAAAGAFGTLAVFYPKKVSGPGENGPGTGESAPRVPVDFAAKSIEDLASQLGV